MERYLRQLPIQVFIHITGTQPSFIPEHLDPESTKRWLRNEPRSMAFTEFWGDLAAVIEKTPTLVTLDRKEQFTAELKTEGDQQVHLITTDESVHLHQEQFLDLWQQIRDVGLCIPQIMPGGLDRYGRYVLPLLAKLPYLWPIRQADKDTQMSRTALGLLYKFHPVEEDPESTPKQLQLV